MANILYISYFFPPVNSVGCRRVYAWAKYLHKSGHRVIVLTADIPEKDSMKNYDVDLSFLEVHRLKYFDLRNIGKKYLGIKGSVSGHYKDPGKKKYNVILAKKILDFFNRLSQRGVLFGYTRFPSFSAPWYFPAYKIAKKLIREKNVNIIITSSPPPVVNQIGLSLKRKCKDVIWIADYRDLWTQHPNQKGLFPFNLIERFCEKRCIAHSDVILTVSEVLKKKLENRYKGRKIITIENGYDFECDFSRVKSENKKIMYFGTIYKTRHNVEPLFVALKQLIAEKKIDNMQIEFYGSSATEQILDSFFQRYPSVRDIVAFKGFLSYSSVIRKYHEASALLFVESDRHSDGILTGKIFEYMAVKKPIVCIGVDRGSYTGEFLNKTGLCLLCGEDIKRIKETLCKLQNDEIIVKPDEAFIARFSHEKQVEKLDKIIKQLLQENQ